LYEIPQILAYRLPHPDLDSLREASSSEALLIPKAFLGIPGMGAHSRNAKKNAPRQTGQSLVK
jgi:hypothetical protein